MIRFTCTAGPGADFFTTLTLDYEARTKSRLRVLLDNGMDAGLFLERGNVLQHGDLLQSETGEVVRVRAAEEPVSTVLADSTQSLLLACYHLGNRHVSLEIGKDRLRYRKDHVLDEMIRVLGLCIVHEMAPFSPESGAYQARTHPAAAHHHHGGHHG